MPDAIDLTALQSLPAAMRERRQWLLWRFIPNERGGKPRKVPFYVSGRKRRGTQGDETDRSELQTFDIALTHLARGHYDGLGFAFLPGDGLVGIDIDGAIDDDGVVAERCQSIIDACSSYTERSPSGKGVHIVVQGETTSFKDNGIGLEVFCGSQFFTCTGRRWPGTPDDVVPIADTTLRRLRVTVDKAKGATKDRARADKPSAGAQPVVGVTDFERVNAAALPLVDLWVPAVFPTARKGGNGAWRVTSKDLGRDLQEDLSLRFDGINDYGREVGLTAIDVLVVFKGMTAVEAMKHLAALIGMSLQSRRPARTRERRADGESTPSPGSAADGGSPPDEPPAALGADDDDEDPRGWRAELIKTSEGAKKDCRENVFTFLMHHPRLKGMVAFDEFSYRIIKRRDPPWRSTPGEWTTADDYELGLWLAQTKGAKLVVKSESTLAAGVAMAANRARFHPVQDYLTGLAWDGVERLCMWTHECLGTGDTTYTRLVGRWFLLGMVNRILNPGCQMDNMIVLEGVQGKMKSSSLRALAGEWFADTPIRIGDKDALLNLAGVWLYEVAELDSFNKAEVTAVKQYVSSRVDRVREPYSRRPLDRKRSCVLAGTTNQHEYFKDSTGSRRFWPLACDGDVDLHKLLAWRDQLFAEAVAALAKGERYHPTREEAARYIEPEQESREITDPWFERIAMWVDKPEQAMEESYTTSEILTGALHVPSDRIDGARQMATRVGIVMRKLGWPKARDATGARLWRYWRPKSAAAASATSAAQQAVESAKEVGHVEFSADEWEARNAG